MRLNRHITTLLVLLATLVAGETFAQNMPERRLVRRGNRQFNKEHYTESVELYEQALKAKPDSFEAQFNLATALSKNRRDDKPELAERAEKLLSGLAKRTDIDDTQRADVAYNLGNVRFDGGNLQGALESYRDAMRLNPDDQDAKFNYAYTKLLLQQQQQQDQQNQQNQEQQNQEQQQNEQDKQDQQQDKQEQQQQQQDKQKEQEQQQNQEQRQSGISPQEQEAMLEAIQAQEDKTQEKLKEAQGVLIRGKRNW